MPVGLFAAVAVAVEVGEELEEVKEDIALLVSISHEYFSRNTRYWGPGWDSLMQDWIPLRALHPTVRNVVRQFSPMPVPGSWSSEKSDDEWAECKTR